MPLRTIKEDTANALTLQWVLHVQNYKLVLDKDRCVGCQICSLACPKEAIKIEKRLRIQAEKAQKAGIDVDLAKCNFCGICDIVCPYGAMKVTSNDKHALPVVEKESFPELTRDVQVNENKCNVDCVEVEDACPLDLIKVKLQYPDGKTVENPYSLSEKERAGLVVKVDVDKEHCPCCKVCEVKLPAGVMHVRKLLQGKIDIHDEKCPEGCTDCLDVCPITGALYLSKEDKKVHPNETFCVYCGACKIVCPVDEAMELKRTHVEHTPVHSGAWNKALERLTSPKEMTKELKTKGSSRARESVKKRIGLKEK
jgi:4Fe-4S ferredoxin